MSITGSDTFDGVGSAVFDSLTVAGNAYSDRIPVTPGTKFLLSLAHRGNVNSNGGGWVGLSMFGADSDATYIREHWMMGSKSTMDFQTVGPIKPDGSFKTEPFGPSNNVTWDTTEWREYEATYTIPSGVNFINLKIEGDNNVAFDNVRLEVIPEPAGLALIIVGMMAVPAYRRRPRAA